MKILFNDATTTIENGHCPECGGIVYMNKNHFYCHCHLLSECGFFIKRNCLKKLGLSKISKEGMGYMLNGQSIFAPDFMLPGGDEIDLQCQLALNTVTEKWHVISSF